MVCESCSSLKSERILFVVQKEKERKKKNGSQQDVNFANHLANNFIQWFMT